MNEVFVIDREFLFKTSIHEITSISVEQDFDIDASICKGNLIISGDYRLHEISINKEDFSFKIPFSHEIRSNINLDTIDLEITDFDYEFSNGDELKVHIEYIVKGEEALMEFDDEEKLQEFLDSNENVEIVNILDDIKEELSSEDAPIQKGKEETRYDLTDDEDIEKDKYEMPKQTLEGYIEAKEYEEANEHDKVTNEYAYEGKEMPIAPNKPNEVINENMILNSINKEEEYIKYHVHTVTINDTVESILEKYNISLTSLKKYNSFEVLELNMKLIIPEYEEL